MAYSELIKNFEGIRDYMREFYVYGFRSREEFTQKSARSYDDEHRRIGSWLGDYMEFRQTSEGKNVFLSIDSRLLCHNPLYQAWKAKSFTAGDVTLHFLIFDILHVPENALSLNEITDEIDIRLRDVKNPKTYDSSTVRKKLNEYVKAGLLCTEKQGRALLYSRAPMTELDCADALDFFTETAPCGVIGSFLLDKTGVHDEHFAFKHHYITQALDSDILCMLFDAVREKRMIAVKTINNRKEETETGWIVPLRIFISVQSGRQYLMAYVPEIKKTGSFRLDYILSVRCGNVCEAFDEYRELLDRMQKHLWGVSTQGARGRIEHVEFTVRYGDGEEYIPLRLEREKRCGRVERLDAHTSRFSADVYDAGEMVPWIRTFICRIESICFSDKKLEEQFKQDIESMYRLYGVDGGDAK